MDKIVLLCKELQRASLDSVSPFAVLNTLNEVYPNLLNEVKKELDSLDCTDIDFLDYTFRNS